MRSLFAFTVFFISISSSAQRTINVDKDDVKAGNSNFFFTVSGEPFVNAKFIRLAVGSPYFRDEWMIGNLTMNGVKEYHGLLLKLDLFDSEVHFQDSVGREMIATNAIQKLILFDTINQKVFTFVNSLFINAAKFDKDW